MEYQPKDIVFVDIQMVGLNNFYIKEFAAYDELDIDVHYILDYVPLNRKHTQYDQVKYHNDCMEKLHGIPAMFPGEHKDVLYRDMSRICHTKNVIYVYGHNKKICLETYIMKKNLPQIQVINLQHKFRNPPIEISVRPSTYNNCKVTTPAHQQRCAGRKVIDLCYNFHTHIYNRRFAE